MFNPDFAAFDDNMFIQLRAHLQGLSVPADKAELNLTIGEPQLPAPDFVAQTIAAHHDQWQGYPKADGDAAFRDDVLGYISRRFGAETAAIIDPDRHIVPVVGTREPLHLLGHMVRGVKDNAAALLPNPFYHAWRAGAIATGGEVVFLNATAETGYLPDLDKLDDELLDRTVIFYCCAPTNPHGFLASQAYYERLIRLAQKHHFLLLSDECYIDIWRGSPPLSALQVASQIEDGLSHLIVLNSLSKRSNAAGLRAGFLCGAPDAISLYKKLVANGAALLPTPLLRAAGALYRDDHHNEVNRAHYQKSFEIAKQHLGIDVPDAGFFIWLPVKDDLDFARAAYSEEGLRVMPGRFMGIDSANGNPGQNFVRIALVHDHDIITQAMIRLSRLYERHRPTHQSQETS